MAPTPSYPEALWPDRHRACGFRLRPHTLGHALLLQRLGSPFAAGNGGRFSQGDILLAACVCAWPWWISAVLVNCWLYRPWARWKAFRRWHHESGDAMALIAYLNQSWAAPRVMPAKDAAARGAEGVHALVVLQRQRWGKTRRQALSTPVSEAIWDQAEALDASGTLRIWGPREDALKAKVDELMKGRVNHG